MSEPGARSTTVRHKSMCFTDFSLVKAHSWNTKLGSEAGPAQGGDRAETKLRESLGGRQQLRFRTP